MSDNVNHPSHYTDGKIEVINFIEDKKLGYHLGNAVKYISRAGKKDPDKYVEDLQKAAWYIAREIDRYNEEQAAYREMMNCFIEGTSTGIIKGENGVTLDLRDPELKLTIPREACSEEEWAELQRLVKEHNERIEALRNAAGYKSGETSCEEDS